MIRLQYFDSNYTIKTVYTTSFKNNTYFYTHFYYFSNSILYLKIEICK